MLAFYENHMNNNTYSNFKSGLQWNTLEGIWYQVALTIHNIFLFKVIGQEHYGLVGTLFSSLYFLISITNLGLDSSLGPFFTIFSKSKQHFKYLLLPQLIPEIILFSICAFLVCFTTPHLLNSFPAFKNVDYVILSCLGLLLVLEGVKKTLRTLLQLAFWNRVTTVIEITSVTSYITAVWVLYILKVKLSLYSLFIPMLCMSTVSTALLGWYIHAWYLTLPSTTQPLDLSAVYWRVIRSRVFTYSIQLGHLFFSANFLVPFFALQCGLEQAGVFKLMCNIAYSLTIIVQKIFGISTDAFFAHIKDQSLEVKQNAFKLITRHMYPLLYIVIIFCCLYGKKILMLQTVHEGGLSGTLIVLFFITHFSEHFFMVYEKFFIVEEKTAYLALFHTSMLLLLYSVFWFVFSFSPLFALVAMLLVRMLAFITLIISAFIGWRIVPTLYIRPSSSYITTSLILGLIMFFL